MWLIDALITTGGTESIFSCPQSKYLPRAAGSSIEMMLRANDQAFFMSPRGRPP